MTVNDLTRGERNLNPFNLMGDYVPWRGLADPPTDDKGFCVFTDIAYGLRAGFLDLHTAWKHDGLNDIEALVSHFAPRSENDVPAYIADVCQQTQWGPDTPLDLDVPPNLFSLGKAFIHHEQGRVIYSDEQLNEAVGLVLPA